jgi:hypothetical protein
VGLQYGTCLLLPFRSLEFSGGSKIFGKSRENIAVPFNPIHFFYSTADLNTLLNYSFPTEQVPGF